MNRSRYLGRRSDPIDRAILSALAGNARITIRDLAQAIGLSAPSVTDRMRRLEDIGVIEGYTVAINAKALGKHIGAHLRIRPLPGETARISAMLAQTPEIVEADRVTGEECFVARAIVTDLTALETLIDRFLQFATTSAAVIQSSSVKRRMPDI